LDRIRVGLAKEYFRFRSMETTSLEEQRNSFEILRYFAEDLESLVVQKTGTIGTGTDFQKIPHFPSLK
jgi:hypothetical protein